MDVVLIDHEADPALQWGWLGMALAHPRPPIGAGGGGAYDPRWLIGLQSHLNAPILPCCTGLQCFECAPTYELPRWDATGSPTTSLSTLPVTPTPWWCGGLLRAEQAVSEATRPRVQPGAVKTFECTECRKVFASRARLRQHERAHSGEQPFGCPECHKRFLRKGDLNVHMRIHTGEKPYGCPECPKRFRNSANRQCHVRTHTGERPYECRECPKRFYESGHLKRHLRTHTGERPFACPECPRRFGQKGNLKTHLLRHAGDKLHQCTECPKRFNKSHSLKTHLLAHRVAAAVQEEPFVSIRAPIAIPASAAGLWARCGGYGVPPASLPPLRVHTGHAWTAPPTPRGLALDAQDSSSRDKYPAFINNYSSTVERLGS